METNKEKPILVMDSGPIIRGFKYWLLAARPVLIADVLVELKTPALREAASAYARDVIIDADCLKIVRDEARKCGDLSVLSVTDTKVIAVALQYCRQMGVELKPTCAAKDKADDKDTADATVAVEKVDGANEKERQDDATEMPGFVSIDDKDSDEEVGEEETADSDASSSNSEGWIHSDNVAQAKAKMIHQLGSNGDSEGLTSLEESGVRVACMTTDYAMQNVLCRLGIPIVSVDGLVIRKPRVYTLFCFACSRLQRPTERYGASMRQRFCVNCGKATLRRVLRPAGDTTLHDPSIKVRVSSRGTRFSLPNPQGGKHAKNPVLSAFDKRGPANRPSKKVVNRMETEMSCGFADGTPFQKHDISSRAGLLGIYSGHTDGPKPYWERRNPNESRPSTGNRKKRRK